VDEELDGFLQMCVLFCPQATSCSPFTCTYFPVAGSATKLSCFFLFKIETGILSGRAMTEGYYPETVVSRPDPFFYVHAN